MKVRAQAAEVKRLQAKRGGWDDDMEKVKQNSHLYKHHPDISLSNLRLIKFFSCTISILDKSEILRSKNFKYKIHKTYVSNIRIIYSTQLYTYYIHVSLLCSACIYNTQCYHMCILFRHC